MQFDVYFIGELVDDKLTNLWTGEAFAHPSEMSPFYYNKREMPAAYRLIAGLQGDRLRETGGELRLLKQSFNYQGEISEIQNASTSTDTLTGVNDTVAAK